MPGPPERPTRFTVGGELRHAGKRASLVCWEVYHPGIYASLQYTPVDTPCPYIARVYTADVHPKVNSPGVNALLPSDQQFPPSPGPECASFTSGIFPPGPGNRSIMVNNPATESTFI